MSAIEPDEIDESLHNNTSKYFDIHSIFNKYIYIFWNFPYDDIELKAYNELTTDKGHDNFSDTVALAETTTCIVCQKSFTSDKRMQIHLVKKHLVRNDQNVSKEYKCDKCEKFYTTRANLLIHERSHTGSIAVR